MRVVFIGQNPLAGWYGLTMTPGEEIEIPEAIAWRVLKNPQMFRPVAETDETPKRRGRPRKVAQ